MKHILTEKMFCFSKNPPLDKKTELCHLLYSFFRHICHVVSLKKKKNESVLRIRSVSANLSETNSPCVYQDDLRRLNGSNIHQLRHFESERDYHVSENLSDRKLDPLIFKGAQRGHMKSHMQQDATSDRIMSSEEFPFAGSCKHVSSM